MCPNILVQHHVRRDDREGFYRTWDEFKAGFGDSLDLNANYWLGNEQLYKLTRGNKYKLRFELVSAYTALTWTAEYDYIAVGNESTQYTLTLAGFNAGSMSGLIVPQDAMRSLNGMKFTTYDRDNDLSIINCAHRYGGFWYNNCGECSVNGDGDNFIWDFMVGTHDRKLIRSRMFLVCR